MKSFLTLLLVLIMIKANFALLSTSMRKFTRPLSMSTKTPPNLEGRRYANYSIYKGENP